MKARICVVTFYNQNYGAFLQAYALQKFLINAGYDPFVLNYNYSKDHTVFGVPLIRIKSPYSFVKSVIYRMLIYKTSRKNDRVISEAAEKNIVQSAYYRTYDEVVNNPPYAEIYVVGSDQVWNPNIFEQGFPSRLLLFANNQSSVICSYAASIGILYLNGAKKRAFLEGLRRFDSISVRESRAAITLKDVTDKKILVHRDPALLLSANEWSEFSKSVYDSKPYVFLYLAQKSPDLINYAKNIARKNGWAIVNCPAGVRYSIKCENKNGILNNVLSPMEFVGGIKNAAYVVTNSFHCLVFSIHFKKKAYVQIPPKGSARLAELINSIGLERLTNPEEMIDSEIDRTYENADAFLSNVRSSALEYFADMERIWKEKNAD